MRIKGARKLAAGIFGSLMAFPLLLGPVLITGPAAALAVLAVSGFGYAAYTANTMAFPGDVVPHNAVASVWGVASVGAGLGGFIFQGLSGIAVKKLSAIWDHAAAYNTVFLGYGVLAVIGLSVVLFVMPLTKDEGLAEQEYSNKPE